MIEARELTKHYGDKAAVDHLTFTVEPGQVTGFLGPNGAGRHRHLRPGRLHPGHGRGPITHTHEQSGDLLSPWQGFGVLCIWTVLALAVAAYLLERRDA